MDIYNHQTFSPKIGLIIPGNLWYAPYVKIYEEILNEKNIEYDILSWDREGKGNEIAISFIFRQSPRAVRLVKVIGFLRYRIFLLRKLKIKKYQKLIIFGPQIGLLLNDYLIINYKKNFILDYRDLSIDQILKKKFEKLLDKASLIAISSPGFIGVLPARHDYLISHNIQGKYFHVSLNNSKPFSDKNIKISTIGAIRDVDSNLEMVRSLGNDRRFLICFNGQGSEVIENLTKDYSNMRFSGFYNKEQESELIGNADFLNIYYPDLVTHNTALSNRFYNAIVYHRPMIVKTGSIQGDIVEKYNIGVAIANCKDLGDKLIQYRDAFDFEAFRSNCNKLLQDFGNDYRLFREKVSQFIDE